MAEPMQNPVSFRMLINGQMIDTDKHFGVINPSTGQVFAEAPECTKDMLNEAVRGAKEAQKTWANTSHDEKRACMDKLVANLKSMMKPLSETLVKEQGKPMSAATGEIAGCIAWFNHQKQVEMKDKILVDNDKETVIEKRVPLGVVGGITPWNFPPLMAAWKLGEAVMTGNTLVLKPSPYTPLTTLLMGEACKDAFPPGVVNFVSGSDAVGAWITEHPDIAKISFTGSVRTGKAVQSATASTLKRLTLELGGNDAAIVLPTANPKEAAAGLFAGSMANSGQVCAAIKRAFVHESQAEEIIKELTIAANNAKVGDGFAAGTEFGPIQNKMQFERVKELVEDAKRQPGVQIHSGGAPLAGDGYFFPPTIISGLKEGTRIVDEEQFGPVLPVITYKNIDEAIERANDTQFGLGGSVWGPVEEAAEVAGKMDTGTVWINSHIDLSPNVPFGGRKESGVGRQLGDSGFEGNTDKKIVRIPKPKKAKL